MITEKKSRFRLSIEALLDHTESCEICDHNPLSDVHCAEGQKLYTNYCNEQTLMQVAKSLDRKA